MSDLVEANRAPAPARGSSSERIVLGAFAATLFVSALMLFSVQPMFAKMALPKLGGSPSVWAVSLCFFQATLLAGYAYAHGLNRWLSPATAVAAHLALLVGTMLALPIGLPAAFAEPPPGAATLWLAGLLAAGVGLPFFAVSANAPLLQAWFARTGHLQSRDPYFLYAASNTGSLLALLAYPVALEPALGLSAQAGLWSFGFVLLALMIAGCGALVLAAVHRAAPGAVAAAPARPIGPITAADRALWTGLALVPSGLLVAVTTHITTDLASSPFLWIIPLALFLATFILVFRERPAIPYRLAVEFLPIVVLAILVVPWKLAGLVLALVGFLLAALICHRELYLRRPDAAHLTEFYLWMSFGGVLGGVFAAIVAPLVFTSVFEFTLLMLLALMCAPGVLLARTDGFRWQRVAIAAAIGLIGILSLRALGAADMIGGPALVPTLLLLALAAALATRRWPEHRAIVALGLVLLAAHSDRDAHVLHAERSFFGAVRVTEAGQKDFAEFRLMMHGTTIHGAQRIRSPEGAPLTTVSPVTYYHSRAPMPGGVAAVRELVGVGRGIRVGVIGLGTGSLVCYARPGDDWRAYEIDPVVVRIAGDPRYFEFISRCRPDLPVIVGDARLTVAKEPSAAFDYLVVDAFSSDSVPVHLLTREALELYLDRTAPGGLVALHVTNRNMDLSSAVAATVRTIPGVLAQRVHMRITDRPGDASTSEVVFISRSAEAIARARKMEGATDFSSARARPWTDDFSDVLSAMLRRLWP